MSGRTAAGRRTGAVEKPWASGRVLTPEQRARKQEADRKANRFLKKEVQDRLILLEARVLELEKTSPTGPNDSGVELTADGNLQYSNPGLAEVHRANSGTATQAAGKTMGWGTTMQFQSPSVASESAQLDALVSPSITSPDEGYFPNGGPHIDHVASTAYNNSNVDALQMTPAEQASGVAPDFTDVITTARTRPDGRHMTCFLNNLVNYIRNMAPNTVCFDDQYNQDLIVASVMKGWDQTLSRYQQKCPLWDVLRLVDTYLFKDCNFIERISALRMLHKRYLYEVNANLPTAGPPPPWFRPQYSEKVFFHDPVIDHLTWPRLRERLIASEQDRMTNKFWALFVKNLRVTWRYEPIDIMTYSSNTRLYQLSPMFETAIMDMTNWRMDMDFFRGVPQLAGDVPPYNYMPLHTVSPKFGVDGDGQGQTLSPRFGLPQHEQEQQVVQQVEDTVPEDSWIPRASLQPGSAFPGSSHQLGDSSVIKMAPTGMWGNFYS